MPSPDGERPPAEDEGPLDPRDRDRDETRLTGTGERSIADAALRYARLGWHVFPVEPKGKRPLTVKGELEHGHLDGTWESEVVERWWERWPSANIGVALEASGLAVIDVDPRNGGDLGALMRACDIGSPLVQHTGGGGTHLIYRDSGVELRSSLKHIDLPGFDVKRRGYIVVPPSRTDGEYTWDDDDWSDITAMPNVVLDLLRAPTVERVAAMRRHTAELDAREQKYVDSMVTNVVDEITGAKVERHNTLRNGACRFGEFVGSGLLDRATAYAQLVAAGERMYGETLYKGELDTIEWGLTKGAESPSDVPEHEATVQARTMLAAIADADHPSEQVELYAECVPHLFVEARNNPELRDALREALARVFAVGGSADLDVATLRVTRA